ncbi:Chromate resistance protein ChrB [Microlunatus soli]|uniref:Chromate resistance protein ChrB n=1 Tax=Microlunatus soli TaxID=630515 RepID=UPI000B850817|nr:Chromate resistance protein ChrB [Microlunatus soli]
MTNTADAQPDWQVVLLRLPSSPSRHRVAAWRRLRKAGALSLGPGVWAVPDVPAFVEHLDHAVDNARRAGGEAIVLQSRGREPQDKAALRAMFEAARNEEWAEFLSDCAKFRAELAKEIRIAKFTLAELEEEEQSMQRLRRWHRELTARDVFGAAAAADAGLALKDCVAACEDYAERVYDTLHGRQQPAHDPGGDTGSGDDTGTEV